MWNKFTNTGLAEDIKMSLYTSRMTNMKATEHIIWLKECTCADISPVINMVHAVDFCSFNTNFIIDNFDMRLVHPTYIKHRDGMRFV